MRGHVRQLSDIIIFSQIIWPPTPQVIETLVFLLAFLNQKVVDKT